MLPRPTPSNQPRHRPPASFHHAPAEVRQPALVRYSLLLVGAAVLVYGLHTLDDLLLPLLYAILLTLLLMPLATRLERWGWPRLLAISATILLVMLGMGVLFYFFGSQLAGLRSELPLLRNKLLVLFDQAQVQLGRRFAFQPISHEELLDSSLAAVRQQASRFLGSTLSTTIGILSTVTLVPIYIFCFLYYRDHLRQFMFRFVEPDKRTTVLQAVGNIQTVVQGYIAGLLTVIALVSLMNSVGLLLIGVKYAIFFAIFASILAVIPYVGITVGSLVPALLTFVETGSLTRGLLVIGVFMVVQFISDNILAPLITASKVSLNPLTAIIALILGAQLWGIPGMILSVPLSAIIKVVLDANKATEPWGFLLGDVSAGEAPRQVLRQPLRPEPPHPAGLRGLPGRLWALLGGRRPGRPAPLRPEPVMPPMTGPRRRAEYL